MMNTANFKVGLVIGIAAFLSVFSSCKKTACEARPVMDCICTMDYNPVCGCDGRTYSNECAAACAGVQVVAQGECGN